jgi:hypothetical protein
LPTRKSPTTSKSTKVTPRKSGASTYSRNSKIELFCLI